MSTVVVATLAVAFNMAFAWTEPTATPPSGNTLPPIYNEGTASMPMVLKPLGVSGNLTVNSGDLSLSGGNIRNSATIQKDGSGNVIIKLGN